MNERAVHLQTYVYNPSSSGYSLCASCMHLYRSGSERLKQNNISERSALLGHHYSELD